MELFPYSLLLLLLLKSAVLSCSWLYRPCVTVLSCNTVWHSVRTQCDCLVLQLAVLFCSRHQKKRALESDHSACDTYSTIQTTAGSTVRLWVTAVSYSSQKKKSNKKELSSRTTAQHDHSRLKNSPKNYRQYTLWCVTKITIPKLRGWRCQKNREVFGGSFFLAGVTQTNGVHFHNTALFRDNNRTIQLLCMWGGGGGGGVVLRVCFPKGGGVWKG